MTNDNECEFVVFATVLAGYCCLNLIRSNTESFDGIMLSIKVSFKDKDSCNL